MKTALMTWFHFNNYGTVLQAIALTKVLEKFGCDVDIINYIPKGDMVYLEKLGITKKLKARLQNIFIVNKFSGDRFDRFRREYLHLTEPTKTKTDLENLSQVYDCFVCGSDQMWSPLGFNSRFFLDFVHDRNIKIAYAPSLGVSEIRNAHLKDRYKKLTEEISHLSVREESGKHILEELGVKSKVTLDPTLLLDKSEWLPYASQMGEGEDYVLLYLLSTNRKHYLAAKKIAKKLGVKLKIIPMLVGDLLHKNSIISGGVGPDDFLSLIKNAKYVCTDSFHATIFSIIFNKPFCTFERFKKDAGNNQNTRIYNLLGTLSLTDRIYKGNIDDVLHSINYNTVISNIAKLREDSLNYLKTSIDEVQDYIEHKTHIRPHILEQYSLCCGCGSCANVCPTDAIIIEEDHDGFLRAQVDEDKCVRCGKCNSVCPFQGASEGIEINDKEAFSYKDKDKNLLNSSASGGVGTRLAKLLFKKGYAVVGCEFDKNMHRAVHRIITQEQDIKELSRFSNSKYVQSNFYLGIREVNSINEPIVVIGTPCQIAGARKLLRRRTDVLYIDLICHGVPSSILYDKYMDFLSREYGFDKTNLMSYFRWKPSGWHEKNIRNIDTRKDRIDSEFKDPFMQIFRYAICQGHQCYECRWRSCSAADLRIGDYWGKRFKNDEEGTSIVIPITAKGLQVVNMLKEHGQLLPGDIKDYFLSQQVENMHEPDFWDDELRQLRDPNIDLRSVADMYALPFLKYERKSKHIHFIYDGVKRIARKIGIR